MSSPAPPDPATAASALRPLDRYVGTLAQRVYLSLRESILALEFRPGEALRKPEICAALGVSRSPVSEAVARLAAEALVDVAPQSGTFVARLSMAEIREGAFMRAALELAAVERVAETLTAEQATLLRRNLRLQEALVADGDVAGFHEADTAMHALILSFTGFRRLTGVTQSAWVHVDRARRLLLPSPGRVAATLDEHRAVIEALEAHDPAAARAALRHHLGQLLGALEGVMRARPELFDDAIDPEA
jgi:DNA-binding GntR family transcriptional regulator